MSSGEEFVINAEEFVSNELKRTSATKIGMRNVQEPKLNWRNLFAVVALVVLIFFGSSGGAGWSPATASPILIAEGGGTSGSKDAAHVRPKLIANVDAVKAGQEFMLAIEFDMDPDWHIYYKEAGEAGMPTRVDWRLPPGFTAGPLLWQKPNKFNDAGITTYGYHDKTFIASKVTPPANLAAGSKLNFSADLKWLMCRELCMPGSGTVKLELAVTSAEPKKLHEELVSTVGWQGSVSSLGNDGTTHGATTPLPAGSDDPPSGTPSSLGTPPLVGTTPTSGTTPQSGATPPPGTTSAPSEGTEADAGSTSSLPDKIDPSLPADSILNKEWQIQGENDKAASPITILFSALLGGLILNLMPCVLPVISIKILSFMEQANESPAKVRNLGLVFSAGIISAFMVLAGVVLAIRAAGNTVGWGFQFQYPGFVIAMCVIVLLLAMSLFGVFYISFSAGQQKLDSLASKEGYGGTFFKGVLATTLSTPCTAPFLGTALGFAFAHPDWVVCSIFFAAGLGMSLPYIVLTLQPAWMKALPKPGVWMEKFKESMGFLLLATVVWLLGVVGGQVGADGAMWTGMFLVTIALAAWVVGRFTDLTSSTERKVKVYGVAVAICLAGLYFCILSQPSLLLPLEGKAVASTSKVSEPIADGAIPWQPFTQAALDSAIRDGKTVFLDFTADWCLTCKTNERLFLGTKEVADKVKELNIVPMKADWTLQDPDITRLLKRFKRAGVPLYTVFPSSDPTKPIRLPEVVTKDMILAALDRGGKSK